MKILSFWTIITYFVSEFTSLIFVQNERPAIAFTAEKIAELMATITHTPNDTPDLIDYGKLVDIACALAEFIQVYQSSDFRRGIKSQK